MTKPLILLVDDEVSFVETMAKRLRRRKIKTLKAFSGEECLGQLEANPDLDVIILDVKMPGMDGIELLKRIKTEYPLIEVIMLSGHGTVESGIEGMKLGAYDYLTKPCDIEVLIEKVKKATQKKRAHNEKMHDWENYMHGSSLRDLMVPIEEYATVPEDASVFEAFNALEEAQKAFHPKRYRHRAVLVLDKRKRVIGKLSQHDIIQALEPRYKEAKTPQKSALHQLGFSQKFIESVSMQYQNWDRPLQNLYQKALEQKVRSFMYSLSSEEYIPISATINETIHRLIVGSHQSLLVMDGAKMVGIIRLTDVFDLIHLRLKTLHLAAKIGGRE